MKTTRSRTPVRLQSFLPRLTCLEARDVPATITVDSTLDVSADDGKTTLREALDQANFQAGDDTIDFAPSLFASGKATITLENDLPILTSNISLAGPGAGKLTIRRDSAAADFGLFDIDTGCVVSFSGLTLTDGRGGIGGAVLNEGGTLLMTSCVLTGNTATLLGGAVATRFNGQTTLNECTLSNNASLGEGGALYHEGATSADVLVNCTFSGNSADSLGGAISIQNGSAKLIGCTLSGNSAGENGGAIQNFDAALSLTNCTLSGNSAVGSGGAIHHEGGAATMTALHLTITANRADSNSDGTGTGGGLFVGDVGVVLHNTIVADNFRGTGTATEDDIQGAFVDTLNSQFNLIGTGGAGGLIDGFNNNQVGVADPGLMPLDFYGGPTQTHDLRADSPALDRGSSFLGATATDQRGLNRSVDVLAPGPADPTDIGAVEHQGHATFTVNSISDDTIADASLTLREALLYRRGELGRPLTAAEHALVSGDVGIDDTISLSVAGAITLGSALPDLSAGVTIIGPGAGKLTIRRDGAGLTPEFRVFTAPAGSTVAISGLTLTGGKVAGDGGGLLNQGAMSLASVAVSGNSASGFGGGIENAAGTLTLSSCTISGNSAQFGGGIDTLNGTLTLSNSTISGNSATNSSGGINSDSSTTTLVGCTLTNNRADSDGTLDGAAGGLLAGGTVALRSTIVAGNFRGAGTTADNIQGVVDADQSHFNLIGLGGSGGLSNSNGNRIGIADPGLLPLAFNGGPVQTHALAATSVARDAGTAFLTAVTGNLSGAASQFAVLDATFLTAGSIVRIDDEEMLIDRIAGTTVSVQRGVNGTAATFHIAGAAVRTARDERGQARTHDFAAIANASSGDGTDAGAVEASAGILGVGAGGQPIVKVFDADTHALRFSINPFGVADAAGMPLATGDVTGDGMPDVIVARGNTVRVFDGTNGAQTLQLQPFGSAYRGTLSVASGDLDGDGFADIVVGTGIGALGRVRVLSGRDGAQLWEFMPFSRFYYGLSVATDAGRIVVGMAGFGNRVAVFDFASKSRSGDLSVFAFGSAGVNVAAGDINGDGVSDIIVSAARGANRRVLLYRIDTRQAEGQVLWTGPVNSGLRVAAADLDGDGMRDIVVASGRYTPPRVRGYSGINFVEIAGWQPFDSAFIGGVFVG